MFIQIYELNAGGGDSINTQNSSGLRQNILGDFRQKNRGLRQQTPFVVLFCLTRLYLACCGVYLTTAIFMLLIGPLSCIGIPPT